MNKATEMLVEMIRKCGNNPSPHQLATMRWLATQVKPNDAER